MTIRADWVKRLEQMLRSPLTSAANRTLHREMPIKTQLGREIERRPFAHLELVGRGLAGLSPWLELDNLKGSELNLQTEFRELAILSIASLVDPSSPDYSPFDGSTGKQPLVDSAFLAHAILRAPKHLAAALSDRDIQYLRKAFISTRLIEPYPNNWVLFSALIEVALEKIGETINTNTINNSINTINSWYLGDGIYGDGQTLSNDYYNSFVIQPMLIDILKPIAKKNSKWEGLLNLVIKRAQRYALIQERLIAPDGSFPAIGRSLSYRCAVFQHLAQASLQGWLPSELKPNQIRCCLSSVIERTLGAKGSYCDDGWLQIGLAGHQPNLGEKYISTGSLYLASTVFLPLGLPKEDNFWSGLDLPWTSLRVWSNCENIVPDKSLK